MIRTELRIRYGGHGLYYVVAEGRYEDSTGFEALLARNEIPVSSAHLDDYAALPEVRRLRQRVYQRARREAARQGWR